MARISFRRYGFLNVPSVNESDGENVGEGDVTDQGGAAQGSADVLISDTGNEVWFCDPIHITEPGDKNKLPDSEEAAAASDTQEAIEEAHNTNQEQSESLSRFPERLPSTSQKRRKGRATTRVPDSDTQQETKKSRRARGPNWTSEETQILIACKSQPSLPKGKQRWEAIADKILTKDADQCRQRWDTLQKRDNKTKPTTTTPGPEAIELNGASTSTHPVGKPHVPSSASPNLEVSHPAAFSVEQMPAAVEFEGWRQYEEVCIFIDSYLVVTKTKKDQKCEEAKPMLLNLLWWLHLHSYGRRLRRYAAAARVEGSFPCMGQQYGLSF